MFWHELHDRLPVEIKATVNQWRLELQDLCTAYVFAKERTKKELMGKK